MFRIANQKSTQLIELDAQVMFSRMEKGDGRSVRRFYRLPLERDKVAFFPLAWTIVHPIDDESPFKNSTADECIGADAEVLVLLKGIDEVFSQTVHARSPRRCACARPPRGRRSPLPARTARAPLRTARPRAAAPAGRDRWSARAPRRRVPPAGWRRSWLPARGGRHRRARRAWPRLRWCGPVRPPR